jgi:hypothetical protein
MVTFVLAAISTYLLFELAGRRLTIAPTQQESNQDFRDLAAPTPPLQNVWNWSRKAWNGILDHGRGPVAAVILLALLFALGVTLYALESGPSELEFFNKARRVASAPETVQALLGAVAGMVCRAFPRWSDIIGAPESRSPNDGAPPKPTDGTAHHQHGLRGGGPSDAPNPPDGTAKAELNKWPLLLFAGALSSIVLSALVAPYASTLLERTSDVETPIAKVKFATSTAEKQLIPNVERDIVSFDRFEDFPRSLRFVQYDCGQRALESGGMASFRDNPKTKGEYENFQNAVAFRRQWIPYVNYIVNAQRKGYSIEILKGQVRFLTEKFVRLVSDRDQFSDNYKAILSERDRQVGVLQAEGVDGTLTPEEQKRQNDDPDPKWCDPPQQKEIKEEDVKKLVNNTRYVHGFVAALLGFTGNTEENIWIWRLAKGIHGLDKDINVNNGLANALYLGRRDFGEIFAVRAIALESIKSQTDFAQGFKPCDPKASVDQCLDNQIKEQLIKRYDRARFGAQLRFAYWWAQKGLSSQEDTWPPEDVPWQTAQNYAEHAYQTLQAKGKTPQEKGPPWFKCTDDGEDLNIKDTYAYIKLAFEAYKLQVHKIQPRQTQVLESREILEDARASVLDTLRLLQASRLPGEVAPSCLIEAEAKAWVKRISSHLKLAEAMLR